MESKQTAILIIYTGGTIGMVKDQASGSLVPFDFDSIKKQVPELQKFNYKLDTFTFEKLLDSSDITPDIWIYLAQLIKKNYDQYDGFVVLHGTDTMAYSASALSFLIENLSKPIVFTGSQLPIGTVRTDGKENFISAVEIAAAQKNGQPLVPEVSVFFQNKLYRGNRTTKHNADYFDAFRSHNYPDLAKAGINIIYNYSAIRYPVVKKELKFYEKLDANIGILKLYPGIRPEAVDACIAVKGMKALILESFGSGNAPTQAWFISKIKEVVDRGIVVLNVSQCSAGSVDMEIYEAGIGLSDAGLISGRDITIEAAITKLMFLLAQNLSMDEMRAQLEKSIRGEINA